MADLYPLQESFAYGAVSPRLLNRPSTDRYAQGLLYCRNMLPLSHGSLTKRLGSRFIAEIDETEPELTLIPFELAGFRSACIVIGNQYIQLFDERGPVTHTDNGVELVFNGTFSANIRGWAEGTAGVTGGARWNGDDKALELFNQDTGAGASAYQSVTLIDTSGVQHFLQFDFLPIKLGGGTEATVRLGTTQFGQEILIQDCVPGANLINFSAPVGVDEIWLTFRIEPGDRVAQVDNVRIREFVDPNTVMVKFASPWVDRPLDRLQWAFSPNGRQCWIVHPQVQPYRLYLPRGTTTWLFEPIPVINTPSWWGDSEFTWPRAIAFFQQRSWWAGGVGGDTINSSQIGDYVNLQTGTLATEGIEYRLAERSSISWMRGGRNLVIGTQKSEHVASSDGPALIPGDIDIEKQSAYGAYNRHVEDLGDRVMYVSGDDTKVRTMAYEWTKDAWISVDMSWPSENITKRRLNAITLTDDPETILLATEQNEPFKLVACSYNREQDIVGWSDHDTDGAIHGVAANNIVGGSTVNYIAVRRIVNDGESDEFKLYLEQLSDRRMVDSWVQTSIATPGTVFTGFDHLNGRVVRPIVRDGNNFSTHPPVTVGGGQIQLQWPATTCIVGLPYLGIALTLPMSNAGLNSIEARKKRWSKIFLRHISSGRVVAAAVDALKAFKQLSQGPKAFTLDELTAFLTGEFQADIGRSERTSTGQMDLGEEPDYEDQQVMGTGYDTAHGILIVQDLPVPTEITGIFGDMGVGDLER